MKKLFLCICALFLVVGMSTYALAIPIWGSDASSELMGSRTSPATSGVDFTGDWGSGNFDISWDISFGSGLWTYQYTIDTQNSSDISHLILEVTDDGDPFLVADESSAFGEIKTWTESGGQTLPNPLYGGKFDFGSDPVIYTLITDRAPVYGNFWAKGGGARLKIQLGAMR